MQKNNFPPKSLVNSLMASEGNTSDNFAPVKAFYEGLISPIFWVHIMDIKYS